MLYLSITSKSGTYGTPQLSGDARIPNILSSHFTHISKAPFLWDIGRVDPDKTSKNVAADQSPLFVTECYIY